MLDASIRVNSMIENKKYSPSHYKMKQGIQRKRLCADVFISHVDI